MNTGFDPISAHQKMLEAGFVNLGNLIQSDKVDAIKPIVHALLAGPSQPFSTYVSYAESDLWRPLLLAENGRCTNLFDYIGMSQHLDDVVDALLGRNDVKSLLEGVLGSGYRIWYAQIRRAEVGAESRRMHQDLPGEVGLSILLDETPFPEGTTVFLKGSHKWPRILNSFPFVKPSVIEKLLSGAVGSKGDCYLFYNATWHGMSTAKTKPQTAIILTFLTKRAQSESRRPLPKVYERLGTHLRAALLGEQPDSRSTHPDEFVNEQHQISWFSLWRLPMLLAWASDRVLFVYRQVRRKLR
jgi:putative 2OG-Fe(II) oxygenase